MSCPAVPVAFAALGKENELWRRPMIFSTEQVQAIECGEAVPIMVGQTECVVIRKEVYDRVKRVLYYDGELTDEEAALLGWEAGKSIGWDTPEMAEYDDYDRFRKTP
jgi:hypothetical protein